MKSLVVTQNQIALKRFKQIIINKRKIEDFGWKGMNVPVQNQTTQKDYLFSDL